MRPGSRLGRTWTGSTCSALPIPGCPLRTSARLQAAPGSLARLARPQVGHRPAPAGQRKEERIRAHVILCWSALLLIRIAETIVGAIWITITSKLDLLSLAPSGTRQARAGRPPSSPRPSETCSPSSRSRTRRRSSRQHRQAPDQQRSRPLVTPRHQPGMRSRRSDHRSRHHPGLTSAELRSTPASGTTGRSARRVSVPSSPTLTELPMIPVIDLVERRESGAGHAGRERTAR